MDDITMCSSINCPEKNNCYRQTKEISKSQAWYNYELSCSEFTGFPDFIKSKPNT